MLFVGVLYLVATFHRSEYRVEYLSRTGIEHPLFTEIPNLRNPPVEQLRCGVCSDGNTIPKLKQPTVVLANTDRAPRTLVNGPPRTIAPIPVTIVLKDDYKIAAVQCSLLVDGSNGKTVMPIIPQLIFGCKVNVH